MNDETLKKNITRKKKATLMVLVVISAITMLLGITYAYWILTRVQDDTNELITACLKLELLNADESKTAFELLETEPMSIDDAYEMLKDKDYNFIIKNNCNRDISYYVALENVTPAGTQLDGDDLVIALDNKIFSTYNDLESTDPADNSAVDAKLLRYDTVEKNSQKTYSLGMFINKTSDLDDAGKKFKSKVFITSGQLDETQTHSSQLTPDECFTIDEEGAITAYDGSCGSKVVVPAVIGDTQVKRITSEAFKIKDLDYTSTSKESLASFIMVMDGNDYSYHFYANEKGLNDKLKYTIKKALKNYFLTEFRGMNITDNGDGGLEGVSYYDSGMEELDIEFLSMSFSSFKYMDQYYIYASSINNAKKSSNAQLVPYRKDYDGYYGDNDNLYIYEDAQSYQDFKSSLWANIDQKGDLASASNIYFVSDTQSFDQFKTSVAAINSNIDLSGISPTTISSTEAQSIITSDYNHIVGIKSDNKLYRDAYKYVNDDGMESLGFRKVTTSFDFVSPSEYSNIISTPSSDTLFKEYMVINKLSLRLDSYYRNVNRDVPGFTFDYDDIDIRIYSDKNDGTNILAVLNNRNLDLDNIIIPSIDDVTITYIYKDEFTPEMENQYQDMSNLGYKGIIEIKADSDHISEASSLMVEDVDLSNAVFLNQVDPVAFSNVLNYKEDDLITETEESSNLALTYHVDDNVGLNSLKLPKLANEIVLLPGAFSGLKTDSLTVYNNIETFWTYVTNLDDIINSEESDRYNTITEDYLSTCRDGDYACPYSAFEYSIIGDLNIIDSRSDHVLGAYNRYEKEGDDVFLINKNGRFNLGKNGGFYVIFDVIYSNFMLCEIENLHLDNSITTFGTGFFTLCNVGNYYFSNNLKTINATALQITGTDYNHPIRKVYIQESETSFKNRVKLYNADSSPVSWGDLGEITFVQQ